MQPPNDKGKVASAKTVTNKHGLVAGAVNVTVSAFPVTGNTARLYRAQNTGLVYAWGGSAYTDIDPYTPVRLVAQTDVLGLPEGNAQLPPGLHQRHLQR
jgi:hypothetical protein